MFGSAIEGIPKCKEFSHFRRVLHFPLPHLSFGAGEAAAEPIGTDQRIDEMALIGGGGIEALEVFSGEGLEGGWVLRGDGFSLGVDADFRAFMRERDLPSAVRGPVDFFALKRLASI